ncbi:MAG: DUF616 domain-containing protein [Burkholderiaceae bacterium]|nr:DUF616 domain-containing protein [Burkholderiaceae bacterium]
MTTRILLVTANLGSFDRKAVNHVPQVVREGFTVAMAAFRDENFPVRTNAMHPRLQAKIPKMLAWEYFPGYDYYVWVDGSVRLADPSVIQRMVDDLSDGDIGLFPHFDRSSVRSECDYVCRGIEEGSPYMTGRYGGEWMKEQLALYERDPSFIDDALYIGTYFVYSGALVGSKPEFFSDWFYHCARYSVQDQLSLPYLIHKHRLKVRTLNPASYASGVSWSPLERSRVA